MKLRSDLDGELGNHRTTKDKESSRRKPEDGSVGGILFYNTAGIDLKLDWKGPRTENRGRALLDLYYPRRGSSVLDCD